MNRLAYLVLPLTFALAACQVSSDPDLDQTGERPELPEQNDALVPAMEIPTPEGWGDELPIVPAAASHTHLSLPQTPYL